MQELVGKKSLRREAILFQLVGIPWLPKSSASVQQQGVPWCSANIASSPRRPKTQCTPDCHRFTPWITAFPYHQHDEQALYCKWQIVTETKHKDYCTQLAVKPCNSVLRNKKQPKEADKACKSVSKSELFQKGVILFNHSNKPSVFFLSNKRVYR